MKNLKSVVACSLALIALMSTGGAFAKMTVPSTPIQFPTTVVGETNTVNVQVTNPSGSALTINSANTTFVDKFDSPSSKNNWTCYPDKNWVVTNGVIRTINITSSLGDDWAYIMRPAMSNVTVEADLAIDGSQQRAVSLIVRASKDFSKTSGTGFRFQILPKTGEYLVLYYKNGNATWITSWTRSSAININTSSKVKVIASGTTAKFYVNGTLIWSGSINYDAPGNYAGAISFPYSSSGISNPVVDNIVIAAGESSSSGAEDFTVSPSFVTPVSVPAYGSVNVPVRFSPSAIGSHYGTLMVSDSAGDMNSFALAGEAIDDVMSVTASGGATDFSGHVGGPFAPSGAGFVLKNVKSDSIAWELQSKPDWIQCTKSSGTLAGQGSESISFSTNSKALSLAEGSYSGSAVIVNKSTGKQHSIDFSLKVITSAKPVIQETLNVTCLPGQSKTVSVALKNDSSADRALDATLSLKEVKVSSSALAATAAKAAGAQASDEAANNGNARQFSLPDGVEFASSTLLVRFDSNGGNENGVNDTENGILSRLGGGEIIRRYELVPGLVLVRLPVPVASRPEMEALVRKYNAMQGIRYAQPNYTLKANMVPNDKYYSQLWGMKNNTTAGADIGAEDAWDITTGSDDVIVGVIDTGIDYTHEDLAANMWVNEGEIPDNGIDDDNDGYVDDVYGINAINGTGDPKDDHYHGTHCAGTIGAVGNNGIGVAGVCWKVRLMALKFLNSSGSGNSADAVTCIEYGVKHGCRVLSNSWGGGGYNSALYEMIKAARDAGVLFVVAAGNDSSSIESGSYYPACYDSENVLTVAALTSSDTLAYYSNYGKTMVDIGAPGSAVYSCKPGNSYQSLNGTSMATPHVAGAAALLLARNSSLTYAELKDILMSTSVKISALENKCVSGGRLNVAAALAKCKTWMSVTPMAVENVAIGSATNLVIDFDSSDFAIGDYHMDVTVKANDAEARTATMRVNFKITNEVIKVPDDNELVFKVTEDDDPSAFDNSLLLDNTGDEAARWQIEWDGDLIGFAVTNGTLAASERTNLKISINENFKSRIAGDYTATVYVRNLDSGAVQKRVITIAVAPKTGPLYVNASAGNDNWHGRSATYPRKTIQSTLYDVADGQTVYVDPGVYDPIVYLGSNNVDIVATSGCGDTVIDGAMRERCVTFIADNAADGDTIVDNVSLKGFTLANGWAVNSVGGAALGGSYDSCRILDSQAEKGGGAARARISNSEIRGNQAIQGGGAYYCMLDHVLVEGNVATGGEDDGSGGAMKGGRADYCTMVKNTAIGYGSVAGDCEGTSVSSSIFWRNSPATMEDAADPKFVSEEAGVWSLKASSPRAGEGWDGTARPEVFVKVNVKGNGAVSDSVIYPSNGVAVIKAVETGRPFVRFEENGQAVSSDAVLTLSNVTTSRVLTAVFEDYDFYVDEANGSVDNDGRTPSTPKKTISSVYNLIRRGETVHVASGTYDALNTEGRRIRIVGENPMTTFIDAKGLERCAVLGVSTNATVLSGFTLVNGITSDSSGAGVLYGCLANSIVSNCESYVSGGGAYGAYLKNCILALNKSAYGGAAAYSWLENCSLGGNTAYKEGAGTYACDILRTVIAENYNISGDIDDAVSNSTYVASLTTADGNFGLVSPRDGDLRVRTGSRLVTDNIGASLTDPVSGCVIRANVSGHGSVVPAYALVAAGGDIEFTARESTHEFERFEKDGATISTTNVVRLTDVRADGEITAVYGVRIFYVDSDLNAAISEAESGDKIFVYSGTYAPIDVQDKVLYITGLATNGEIVIDGNRTSRCATLGVYENAPQTVLNNITLANGYADCAAGAYMGILSNCTIRSCTSYGQVVYGGATYCSRLYHCTLNGNINNGVNAAGGASYGGYAERTVFANNTAGVSSGRHVWGGATCYTDTDNCLFIGNSANATDERDTETSAYGGAIYKGVHYNATVMNNMAVALNEAAGGGVTEASMYNSIVYGNTISGEVAETNETEIASMTDFVSSSTGNPLYHSLSVSGCKLAPLSKAIDAGDNSYVKSDVDLAGNARIQGERVDLGCSEGPVELKDAPHMPSIIGASDSEYCCAVRVEWTLQTDAYGFRVYRGLKSNASDAVLIGETGENSFVDTNAVGEVLYRYYVTAWNNAGESQKSAVVQGMALKNLSILTSFLGQGYIGMAYSQQLHGEGGFEPTVWSIESGELPDGFTLDGSGVLSGTFGSEEGTWPIVVALTDAHGNKATAAYTLSAVQPGIIGIVLEAPDLVWTNDDVHPWVVTAGSAAYDGEDAMSSTGVGVSGSSKLTATLSGPGTLTFHWKFDKVNASDIYAFSVDGVTVRKYDSSSNGWQAVSYDISSGSHTLAWIFRGARSAGGGSSAAYLDAFDWKPSDNVSLPTLAEALNEELDWTTDSADPWTTLTGTLAYDGESCATVGKIGNSSKSAIRTTVSGPGTLSFMWRSSCEEDYDCCNFYVNGVLQATRTGENGWAKETFSLTATTNLLEWVYVKDDYDEPGEVGNDSVYLDQVEYEIDENFQSTKGTDVPVPFEWLRNSGVDLSGGYEKAAAAMGKNGIPVWESYVAGLDPTDEDSKFSATIEIVNGHPVVTYTPDLGYERTYKTYGKVGLGDDWVYPATDDCHFFKVVVDLNE